MDGAVEPFEAPQRLTHQGAGVVGQDDVVIALGLVLAAIELHMPGGRAPVDAAVILTGVVFAQAVVFGAAGQLVLDAHAIDRIEREEIGRILLDANDVGRDGDAGIERHARLDVDKP